MNVHRPTALLLALAVSIAMGAAVTAQDSSQQKTLPWSPPTGLTPETAELRVHGLVGSGGTVLLNLASVMALPERTFTCVDPWDGKEHAFSGVLLSDLLSRVGMASGAARITVTARNKYSIPIRRADWEKYGYILAWKIDGHLFGDEAATRNRSPFSIAIDLRRFAELDPSIYKHQLVWQVADVAVE